MNGDYIKLSRNILEWEWYKNEHTKNLFLHCLLKANWKEGKFEGRIIPRGSFVTSVKCLAHDLALTDDEVRTAMKHLVTTGEITKQTTNKYTVITVSNYDLYQNVPEQFPDSYKTDTEQLPKKSQPIPKPFPTIEEKKEIKNISLSDNARANEPLQFNDFWAAYPKKVNMLNAQGEYTYVLETTAELTEEMLICSAKNYAEACRIKHTREQYMKNPENWLRESAWIDYLPENYRKPEAERRDTSSGPKNNKFNNFHQRNYDFDKLEGMLLTTNPGE